MGSPPNEPGRQEGETQIPVRIGQRFAVGKFAVTFDEWDACVAEGGCNGYRPNDEGWGRGNRPVINVNWADANAYAEWLSLKTGKTYRLLSEAEWEYVARAGTRTPFWWGSSITLRQANYDRVENKTLPVNTFQANLWGLFNVQGNVFEWTEDCWNDSNQGNPGDGDARTTGDCTLRVVRGGGLVRQTSEPPRCQPHRGARRHPDQRCQFPVGQNVRSLIFSSWQGCTFMALCVLGCGLLRPRRPGRGLRRIARRSPTVCEPDHLRQMNISPIPLGSISATRRKPVPLHPRPG
jgi:formylglycine-generating enzyme required for sulfatase activity